MPRLVNDRADAILALAGTFRRHGFAGASLSVIQTETGIGRGSLYHFFPAGKTDMVRAVLDEVQEWFDREIYTPLRANEDPAALVEAMFAAVEAYFTSREFVCLFAVITLGEERGAFAASSRTYFAEWIGALTATLRRAGASPGTAAAEAVDTVSSIQGALILTRALDDTELFRTTLARIRTRLTDMINSIEGLRS